MLKFMNRWLDKIGREEHSTQGGILVLQHGLQILDTPGENHQARMLLNVFFFRDSEAPNHSETDLVLGILEPHSINYVNKEKAEHRGLASSYA